MGALDEYIAMLERHRRQENIIGVCYIIAGLVVLAVATKGWLW